MSEMLDGKSPQSSTKVGAAIKTVLSAAERSPVRLQHQTPSRFSPGAELRLAAAAAQDVREVHLHYRHLNQAENYVSTPMERHASGFEASIPADYTRTDFPLEYYFEVHKTDGTAGLYPGFSPALTSQPYFVVRRNT